MTRDQLIETMERALCEYQRPSGAWERNPSEGYRNFFRAQAIAALTAIEAAGMRVVPRNDAVNVVASLAAAISIIERTPQARKAAMSDTAFGIMLDDYTKALAAGRAMLAAQEDSTSE